MTKGYKAISNSKKIMNFLNSKIMLLLLSKPKPKKKLKHKFSL
jgi:hypothetical protein